MKELTKAEEQIMHLLWKKERALVHDVLEALPEPRPAYNTVSTIIRILERKGFVGHKAYGKTHEYFPLISKKDYSRRFFKRFLQNYFGNSYQALTSFFANEKELSLQEMEEIKKMLEEQIDKQKSGNNE